MATYYVAKTGNDSNDGSIFNPWLTISRAVDEYHHEVVAGDVVYVRGGVYNERVIIYGHNGTAINPVTLMAYPGEFPIVDGTGFVMGVGGYLFVNYCAYIIIDGIEIRNSNMFGEGSNGGGVVMSSANNCTVRNCVVHDIWTNGLGSINSTNTIFDKCTVYNTAMSNSNGIYDPGEFWGGGINIRGSTGYVVRNCIVHDIWGEALSITTENNGIVEDNIVYDFYSVGIYLMNAKYNLVQRNLVYQTKPMGDYSQVGIGQWNENVGNECSNNTIINNIVYRARRNFVTDYNNGMVIANNTFVNSQYISSVFFYAASGYTNCQFRNNLVIQEDSLLCISLAPLTGIIFSNNLYNKAYDSDAIGAGDVMADPKICKIGNTNAGQLTAAYFKLRQTSPAINAGASLAEVTDDYYEQSRDASPNIGAIEALFYDVSINNPKIQKYSII